MKNSWKIFTIRLIIFCVLFACFDFIVGLVYRELEIKALNHSPYGMETEYSMWKVNADIIIMGSSDAKHAYIPSLIEEKLGMSVYNCGREGCRFYYQNAVVNGILDRYNPKYIIWSITPDYLGTPDDYDRDRLSLLNPFYKDNEYCRNILRTKSKYESFKLLSSCYTFNSCLTYVYKILMPDRNNEYGNYAPLYGHKAKMESDERYWNDNYDPVLEKVFIQTIERCINNNVKIFFAFTPRYGMDSMDNLLTYSHLKALIEKYNILLIDDLYDNELLLKPELFYDGGHLNNEGAKLFTTLLLKRISPELSIK